MIAATKSFPIRKHDLAMAMVVTRREVRDSFRDWRIIIPIIILTIFFPALMNFTAQRLLGFVQNFGADLIGQQLIPFLLLVVGFFPMSFSLIIALETFVGEKERKSLEPLLATPLTDTQLYIGKMAAALVPPLVASYLGILVYVIGLWFSIDWRPDWQLFTQIVILTTVQGIIMVAGAVVVSSQTTSVRAANLLASFIIVPMALLIQGEAAALFWGNHVGLWWLILALTLTAVVLMRMGIHVFNREDLMGQEIDQLKLGWIWRQFWIHFSGRSADGRYPNPRTWYRQTFAILPSLRVPTLILLIAVIGAILLGTLLADQFVFPATLQTQFAGENISQNLEGLQVFTNALPPIIFLQNVRVVTLQTLLGLFTFGVLGILIFTLPWGLIGFVAAQFSIAGENPLQFILATIVPHAVIELPALLLISAAALRWHAVIIAPPPGRTLSEAFLENAGQFMRVAIGIGFPLLLLGAFVESFVTPQVLLHVYGG